MGASEYTRLKKMYFSKEAADRKEEILQSVIKGKPLSGLYLITFSTNANEQLDIFPSYILLQKSVRNRLPLLVGAAFGRQAAMELVADMASDAFKTTGTCKLRDFLLQKNKVELMG